jgi:hypothetical protein
MFPMAVASDMEHADQTFIPDWPLHWLHGLHALWRHTGDRDLVSRLLARAEVLLRWFVPFQGDDGLLAHVTGWVLIDWSAVGTPGASAALNGLWARALLEFAELADALGDAGPRRLGARSLGARPFGLRAVLGRGLAACTSTMRSIVCRGRLVSQHTNAAAICARLVPESRVPRVLAALLDRARLVRASWILPGATEAPADGDMYAGAATLITGPPEPWWDVEHQIVAAQPFFRYVVHDAIALGRSRGSHPRAVPRLERAPRAQHDDPVRDLVRRQPLSWLERDADARSDRAHARHRAARARIRRRADRSSPGRSRLGARRGADAARLDRGRGRARSGRDREPRGGACRARRSGAGRAPGWSPSRRARVVASRGQRSAAAIAFSESGAMIA